MRCDDFLSALPDVRPQLKESKRAVNSLRDFVDDDDEDDLERVSWTGEPVGSKYKRPWEGINYSGFLALIKSPQYLSGQGTRLSYFQMSIHLEICPGERVLGEVW